MSRFTPPIVDNLLLALVPAARSLLDHSGNGRHPTLAGAGLNWVRTNGVYQLRAEGTGRLVVANDVTLEAMTDFTLCCSGSFGGIAAQRRVLSKEDAGGVQLDVYLDAGTEVEINDGANVRVASVGSWAGVRSFAVVQESGAIGDLYTNGAALVAFDGITTITADNADVTLLNYYDGSTPSIDPYGAILLYNRVLTADEISRNSVFMDSLTSPEISPNRRYFDRGSWVENGSAGGEIASYDLGAIRSGGVADSSGNGNHGTVVGNVSPVFTEVGRAAQFDGVAGYIDITGVADTGTRTISATIRLVDVATIQYLLTSQTDFFGLAPQSAVALTGFYDGAWRHYGAFPKVNQFLRCVWVFDAVASKSRMYVNGTQWGGEADYTPCSLGGSVRIGVHPTAILFPFAGKAADIRIDNRLWSLAEIKADGDRFNRTCIYYEDMSNALPTVAPITAGHQIPGTEYMVGSGTWAVQEDATTGERYIECITAGIISRRNLFAYGTWDLDTYFAGGAPNFNFIANQPTAWNVAGFNGYMHQRAGAGSSQEYRITNGAPAATTYTTANGYFPTGTRQRLRFTRSPAGVFTFYSAQAGSPYTLIDNNTGNNPATDNTHTTSQYLLHDLDAGDRIYRDRQFAGVLPPL